MSGGSKIGLSAGEGQKETRPEKSAASDHSRAVFFCFKLVVANVMGRLAACGLLSCRSTRGVSAIEPLLSFSLALSVLGVALSLSCPFKNCERSGRQ